MSTKELAHAAIDALSNDPIWPEAAKQLAGLATLPVKRLCHLVSFPV